MNSWGVIVCLVALAGVQVFAEELTFPENARGLSSARIVSGWEAEEGQIPWQLSLRMVSGAGSVSSCGGSIIHPEWGLTAAHCTAGRVTMVLRAGAVSLTRPELLFDTFVYFNHPQYNSNLASIVQPHDIAILKFQRTVTFSPRVQPIRVQRSEEKDRNYEATRLEASGWGRTWTNGAAPENLQWVYLLGDANQRCWSAYGGSSIIVDSTICASAYNVSSQSTCQGDSGGPLVELEEDGQYTLVGVTSFVSALGCHADMPAGFIRPGHYHDWITQVTGINFDWEPKEPETSEEKSSEEKSSEEKSSEEKSSEESSSEQKTSEEKSSEESSSEQKTSEEKSSEQKTSEEKSSEESSSEQKTSEEKSSEQKTSEEKSSEESSSEQKTSEEKSSEQKTSEEKSSEESSSEQKTSEEKSSEQKTSEEKSSEESSSQQKTSEEKSSEQKTSEEKSSEESSSEQKTSEEKSSEQKTSEEKSSEESSSEQKTSEEKSSEQKTSEEKSNEESSSEQKTSEEKSSEQKTREEKSSEESSSEQKTIEDKSSEEEASEEAASEEAASEEVTSEEEQSRFFFNYFRRAFAGF